MRSSPRGLERLDRAAVPRDERGVDRNIRALFNPDLQSAWFTAPGSLPLGDAGTRFDLGLTTRDRPESRC